MNEYYRFIAVFEAQVTKQVEGQQVSTQGLTLKRLLVWTQESLLKLRIMSVLADCYKQRIGTLVSTIYDYTNLGDPLIQQFIKYNADSLSYIIDPKVCTNNSVSFFFYELNHNNFS